MLLTDLEISHEEIQVPTVVVVAKTLGSLEGDNKSEVHNLKSTSLIMRTMRSANQFNEAMRELQRVPNPVQSSPVHESHTASSNNSYQSTQKDHFSRSSQLITNMNAITKSNSASNNWWKVEKCPSPTRRYSSSVDGDALLKDDSRSTSRRFSHDSAVVSENSTLDPPTSSTQESNLKHVNHLNSLLEETRRLSDQVDGQLSSMLLGHVAPSEDVTRKPIAAPRIKKLGSSSVMSQLTQLRRMYEAADEAESDTSTKADEEVRSFLGDRDTELFSDGSWSKMKAKRNRAILNDLHLGTAQKCPDASYQSNNITVKFVHINRHPPRLSASSPQQISGLNYCSPIF